MPKTRPSRSVSCQPELSSYLHYSLPLQHDSSKTQGTATKCQLSIRCHCSMQQLAIAYTQDVTLCIFLCSSYAPRRSLSRQLVYMHTLPTKCFQVFLIFAQSLLEPRHFGNSTPSSARSLINTQHISTKVKLSHKQHSARCNKSNSLSGPGNSGRLTKHYWLSQSTLQNAVQKRHHRMIFRVGQMLPSVKCQYYASLCPCV